ncbi:hypothetical protein O181_089442 [Austropuccinia psidii MF-1]|uniref:Uncharacterized protein n=1 Tax=Austropuccinia psidii MF-1 TaxID=1389203 RepID=A0A9Q3P6Q3_9BASI|nr:hypothetical protein [Austropuccinia psidii MF-1]
MEDARGSNSSQRSEQVTAGSSGNIPVSVQELVYGSKEAGVGTSSQLVDRKNELLNSSKEDIGNRKDQRPSEGLETHFFQSKSPKDKSLVEKQNHFVRGQEERFGSKEG